MEFSDGETTILVETNEEVEKPSSSMGTAGISNYIKAYSIEKTDEKFTNSMGIISYTSNKVLNEIEKITNKPDTVGVEFGVKFTGEGKTMIASGRMEANYTVKLSWKNSE